MLVSQRWRIACIKGAWASKKHTLVLFITVAPSRYADRHDNFTAAYVIFLMRKLWSGGNASLPSYRLTTFSWVILVISVAINIMPAYFATTANEIEKVVAQAAWNYCLKSAHHLSPKRGVPMLIW